MALTAGSTTSGGFAALPPEINSARIYAGPGSASMLAAATAWDSVAAELRWSATFFQVLTSGLTDEVWQGPASVSMAAAATQYASWMSIIAEQARQTADQARAAAAAFQRAYAATVPPAVIAANRAMLTKLVATNGLGQNSAAIAANEAQYGQMWTQDAVAMDAYASASAAATTLTPFTVPLQNTDPAGPSHQAASVDQAATTIGAQLVPGTLQQLAAGGPIAAILQQANAFLETSPVYQAMSPALTNVGQLLSAGGAAGRAARSAERMIGPVFRYWFPPIKGGMPASALMSDVSGEALGSALVGQHGPSMRPPGGGGVSAGAGRAVMVGSLSVPQTWGTPIRLTATASSLPIDGLIGSPVAGAAGLDRCYDEMFPATSAVGTPRAATAGHQGDGRAKLVPQLSGTPPTREKTSGRMPFNQDNRGVAGSLSDRERAELEVLRKRAAELVKRRDEAADTIRNAIRS